MDKLILFCLYVWAISFALKFVTAFAGATCILAWGALSSLWRWLR